MAEHMTRASAAQVSEPRQDQSPSAASASGEPGSDAARPGERRLSSVASAIALLKAFSEDEVDIGVSTLARRLGIAKSTVHRLASTLVSEGMLEQNPENGKYRLGIALFGLGALVRRRMDVSTEAKPYLFDLRETTGETVHLAILDRFEIMYVYNLESMQAIRMRSDIGVRKPAYCTAEGLAILAFQPGAVIDDILARGLKPRTPKTNTDPDTFQRVLAGVRERGYAVEDEESEVGMRSLAAPIRNGAGEVAGAVGVAGPVQRLPDEALASFAPHVLRTADAISVRLGYRSSAAF